MQGRKVKRRQNSICQCGSKAGRLCAAGWYRAAEVGRMRIAEMLLRKRLVLIEKTINRKLPFEFNFEYLFYIKARANH
ncbi:hypothetical protein ASG21_12585 [Chryseobacterium sp. Leaf394]|nr:hypothetical protein ASG21_12585 [Chryseobacterium sp. Leaf394]